MTLKLILEAIIYTLLYSAFLVALFKKQGATYQLYNYPPAIQKRAIEKGIITQEQLNDHAKKNKIIGIILMILPCALITICINKQYTFLAGFLQSYLFLKVFSLFDALVIDSIWFCHSKWWVIPGTEDMTDAYHDYKFHWKWFLLGFVSVLPVCVITGGIVALVGLVM